MALALLAREYDASAVRGRSDGQRVRLHNVAPASGENARCNNSAAVAVVRYSLPVEIGICAVRRATHDEV
jgi:hypothetical protein